MSNKSKDSRDNRANQLNPNNDAYWRSRGEPAPPTSTPPSAQPAQPVPGKKGGDSR